MIITRDEIQTLITKLYTERTVLCYERSYFINELPYAESAVNHLSSAIFELAKLQLQMNTRKDVEKS